MNFARSQSFPHVTNIKSDPGREISATIKDATFFAQNEAPCWNMLDFLVHFPPSAQLAEERRVEGVAEGRTSVSPTCSTSVISATLIHFWSTRATGFSSRHTHTQRLDLQQASHLHHRHLNPSAASASTCRGRDGIREANRNCIRAQRCYLRLKKSYLKFTVSYLQFPG